MGREVLLPIPTCGTAPSISFCTQITPFHKQPDIVLISMRICVTDIDVCSTGESLLPLLVIMFLVSYPSAQEGRLVTIETFLGPMM